ncbi:MAG TPA: outer membrane lipoprotein carrier protein LolA [Ideonella sp.]|uniref:LolA family protein n=1 Tax=Ideonella sp. TaxID=1929293 RepID=UPI002E3362BD|nr:outer membrane lipoprotein carrier protein LolA [Ideonella sp.]HEX5686914.1 outer membrane lipoprotein carrier protein LolA [Ideonella sp.]
MNRRRLLCTSVLMALAAPALHAADGDALAERVKKRLSDAPVQRGEFEQRKAVKGFKHPLVSRGDYLFARERGVVWRTREPFASTLVLTRERLVSRGADGASTTAMDARSEPGLRAVNQLLFALLSADLATLAQRFRIEGQAPDGGLWQLTLTPRDATLAAWLQKVELQGDRQVQTVQWQEASGDASLIRFSSQTSAAALSAEEAKRFD